GVQTYALPICLQAVLRARVVVAPAAGLERHRVDHRRDVAVAQPRRLDLGVPAAAGGDLDDGLAAPQAEEGERLARMAVGVAGHVLRGAPGARQGLVRSEERRVGKEWR